jgi:hypothetical protein
MGSRPKGSDLQAIPRAAGGNRLRSLLRKLVDHAIGFDGQFRSGERVRSLKIAE